MTEAKKGKNIDKNSLEEENQTLQNQLNLMQEIQNLRTKEYYRHEQLLILQRIAIATERQAQAMEILAQNQETEEESSKTPSKGKNEGESK